MMWKYRHWVRFDFEFSSSSVGEGREGPVDDAMAASAAARDADQFFYLDI